MSFTLKPRSYCPPSQSNFFDNLLTVCNLALAANKQIAIMGDLNCNLLTPSLSNTKLLFSFCRQLKLTELVCTPTRITSDSSVSHLDVILTNTTDHFHQTFAISFSISDHHLVLTHLSPSGLKKRNHQNISKHVIIASLNWNYCTNR